MKKIISALFKNEWHPWNLLTPIFGQRSPLGIWLDESPAIFAVLWFSIMIPIWVVCWSIVNIIKFIIKIFLTPWKEVKEG